MFGYTRGRRLGRPDGGRAHARFRFLCVGGARECAVRGQAGDRRPGPDGRAACSCACWPRGHCLSKGCPGLAKTLAVETLARTVGGCFVRLQFTPDLVPSDLVGTRIYRPSTGDVRRRARSGVRQLRARRRDQPGTGQGAVRAARGHGRGPRVDRRDHLRRPAPFLVLATQNPIESEGVYPLPEAQRDRFLMKVVVDYPTPLEEVEIVRRMGVDPPRAEQVLEPGDLLAAAARRR